MSLFLPKKLRTLQRSPRFSLSASGRQIIIPFRPLSLLLILILTFLSGFLFLRSDIFLVKTLDFQFEKDEGGSSLDSAAQALVRQRLMEEVLARSIFFLDVAAVEGRIKENFPTVKAVSLQKLWPERLFVKVTVRVPLAIVEDRNKERFLVDEEGFLFRKAASELLPVVSLGTDFLGGIGMIVGDTSGLKGYLETLRLVGEKGLKTVAIYLRPTAIELQLEATPAGGQGTAVFLDPGKNITEQVELMRELLQRYRLNGQTPHVVDLRFGRPVVKL